jgi:hypothetical protein
MIKEIINEFRRQNGRHPLRMDDHKENQNCLWHCLHMAKTQNWCHAPEYLRPGKSEACAVKSFFHDSYETLRAIIFEQFADSPEHRDIILFNDNLACAFHIEQYQVYVVVRGW